MALTITIHNFPEGIATFLAAMQEPALKPMVKIFQSVILKFIDSLILLLSR
jgi:zinc transporter ZupT